MNKIILITLVQIIACLSFVSAQSYIPIEFGNTRWMYTVSNFGGSNSYCYFSKDTTGYYYGGNKFWKIEKVNSPNYSVSSDYYFLFDDTTARKVYTVNAATSSVHLLYDFSANAGDTINSIYNLGFIDTVIVDSIKYFPINSILRKHIYSHSDGFAGFTYVWIEGIGSTNELFYPSWIFPDPSYNLVCHEYNSFVNYGDSLSCSNFLTSIPKSPQQTDQFLVTFNSICNSINIVNYSGVPYTFSLFDVSGKRIERKSSNAFQENINLLNHSGTMLVFKIETVKGKVQSGKIILH